MNDTSVGQTQNRLAIYKQIIELKTNDTIRVTLVRNGQEITLHYVLQEVRQARKQEIGQRKPIARTKLSKEQPNNLNKNILLRQRFKKLEIEKKRIC